jgi:hypothetical protein
MLSAVMHERLQLITHQGQAILLIDFSHCTAKQMMPILDEIEREVAKHPKASLVTLADLTKAKFDKTVATRIKEVLARDRPFVKRSAWIGTESLPNVFFENFKTFSNREFVRFKTREEAMEWLVKD